MFEIYVAVNVTNGADITNDDDVLSHDYNSTRTLRKRAKHRRNSRTPQVVNHSVSNVRVSCYFSSLTLQVFENYLELLKRLLGNLLSAASLTMVPMMVILPPRSLHPAYSLPLYLPKHFIDPRSNRFIIVQKPAVLRRTG